MISVVEVLITKYDRTVSHNPNEGTPIWGRIMTRENEQSKKKSIHRLANILKASDPESYDYVLDDTLIIVKEKKNGAFNQKGETVYTRDISGSEEKKQLHKKASQRLARFLSKNDSEYNYYSRIELIPVGKNGYQVSYRYTNIMTIEDKLLSIKRKITGRKSALTRNINKAKKVREEYKTGLFPEGYRTDKRFLRLLKHLPAQRDRLHAAKRMTPEEIEDVVGNLKEISVPSLKRIMAEVA